MKFELKKLKEDMATNLVCALYEEECSVDCAACVERNYVDVVAQYKIEIKNEPRYDE